MLTCWIERELAICRRVGRLERGLDETVRRQNYFHLAHNDIARIGRRIAAIAFVPGKAVRVGFGERTVALDGPAAPAPVGPGGLVAHLFVRIRISLVVDGPRVAHVQARPGIVQRRGITLADRRNVTMAAIAQGVQIVRAHRGLGGPQDRPRIRRILCGCGHG